MRSWLNWWRCKLSSWKRRVTGRRAGLSRGSLAPGYRRSLCRRWVSSLINSSFSISQRTSLLTKLRGTSRVTMRSFSSKRRTLSNFLLMHSPNTDCKVNCFYLSFLDKLKAWSQHAKDRLLSSMGTDLRVLFLKKSFASWNWQDLRDPGGHLACCLWDPQAAGKLITRRSLLKNTNFNMWKSMNSSKTILEMNQTHPRLKNWDREWTLANHVKYTLYS